MYFSRGKNKVQDPYTFVDMYEEYISDKEQESPYYVTYEEYVNICSLFYKSISKLVVDEGIKFRLPFGMGHLFVRKKKPTTTSHMPIDWVQTAREGKVIYNFNEHTKGFGYKFHWSKPNNIKYKFTYRLELTRENKRYLAKAIKQNKKDYFEQ